MFAREVGMTKRDVLALASRGGAQMPTDQAALFFDALAELLNKRIGELYGLRIELERREATARRKRIANRARQECHVIRQAKS